MGYPAVVTDTQKDMLIWVGGAAAVVVAVLVWLYWDQPPENLLPKTYRFGVM